MNQEKHLYMILHPNPSLVASQYKPEQFASIYVSGSTRHYEGKVVFAEIDINFRHAFFNIERGLEGLVPHESGRPKATKFIGTYRVLEHMDFNAIQQLYISSPSGAVLGLSPRPFENSQQQDSLRIFAEIAPLRMLLLTRLNFPEFGNYITRPDNPKSAPAILYTQIDFDIEEFMREVAANPFLHTPIPSLHSSKLRDAVNEMLTNPDKTVKSLSLDSSFNHKSYKYIRHGFMFASQKDTKFFPMPSMEDIEHQNFKFWKEM
ncbi:MAG: hypothetical protein E4H36_05320 [Spirochaetales bacterium]|nr:MAG: hypothetical protein E4H36_05320 [Spirochaetales bacterium]